jgi:hypothetical protein
MEQEDFWRDEGSFGSQEIGWAFVTAGAVFASGVVPKLVSGAFGKEIGSAIKALSIIELGFDGVVDTFDICIGIRAGRRIKGVLGAPALFDGEVKAFWPIMDGIAIELRAQIGGDDHLAGIHFVLVQMFEESFDGEGGVCLGQFVAVSQELSATGEFSDGVLEARQTVFLHLWPEEGNVGQVLHIHLEASKGSISGFHRAEVIFAAMSALGRSGQLMDIDNALDGIMAQGQVKFGNEPTRAETRSLLAQPNDPGLQGLFSFVRAGSGSAAKGSQAGITQDLEAAQPFAHGVAAAVKVAGGGFDTIFFGEGNQLMTQGEFGVVSADHGVVSFVGGWRSTRFVYHALVSPDVRRRCPPF